MGPRFKVSSVRLEKPGIELTTPGLEGKWLNHYTTEASLYLVMLTLYSCNDFYDSMDFWRQDLALSFNMSVFRVYHRNQRTNGHVAWNVVLGPWASHIFFYQRLTMTYLKATPIGIIWYHILYILVKCI